ncbi:hypothetical protein HYZ97_05080 [Candidatus Pacearchaeota archaeon]|nr:hypothetical protein [Candidatus Pacearchaeota archaeon]
MKQRGLTVLLASAYLLGAPLASESAAAETRDSLDKRMIQHEGYRTKVYKDSEGIPTIGIGFNLSRKDAPFYMQKIGADHQRIMEGKQELTERQVTDLYLMEKSNVHTSAKRMFPDFDTHPVVVQEVVFEMIYNLGARGFGKFEKTVAAIKRRDYETAAQEMQNSKWYAQVGNRSKTLVQQMKSAAVKQKSKQNKNHE